jgi:hypothetical protein
MVRMSIETPCSSNHRVISLGGLTLTLTIPQDVLVVTAPGSGAEIIPFLKTWVNLPMAIGFTVLYAKVSFRCVGPVPSWATASPSSNTSSS